MIRMFNGASSFDQPLDNWDVSKVRLILTQLLLITDFVTPILQRFRAWTTCLRVQLCSIRIYRRGVSLGLVLLRLILIRMLWGGLGRDQFGGRVLELACCVCVCVCVFCVQGGVLLETNHPSACRAQKALNAHTNTHPHPITLTRSSFLTQTIISIAFDFVNS